MPRLMRGRRAKTATAIAAACLGAGLLAAATLRAQPAAPPPAAPLPAGVAAPAPAAPPSSTVKIIFITVPMKKATVFWGKKNLGTIAPKAPLVVQRPRDSGPLDVTVRADGYIPVQTRAYTFGDNKVAVKITPVDQKNTLLGYREEVPTDGGVPEVGGGVGATGAPFNGAGASGPDGGLR